MQWKEIEGFKDYLISEDGQVKKKFLNKYRMIKPNIAKRENCIPSVHIALYDGTYHLKSLPRLVAETFIPNPDGLRFVTHIDGNPENNHISNIAWTDRKSTAICKEVKNTTTGEVFDSLSSAAKKAGVSYQRLANACNSGRPINGVRYVFTDNPLKEFHIKNLPNEEWTYLRDTDNQFMISNKGRLKCLERIVNNIFKKEYEVTKRYLNGKAKVHIPVYKDGKRTRKFFTIENEIPKHFQ